MVLCAGVLSWSARCLRSWCVPRGSFSFRLFVRSLEADCGRVHAMAR